MKFKGPQKEEMISAGIDIGTSTTKLVISRFTLMNMAGGAHVPRIEIIDKQVIYHSPIYRHRRFHQPRLILKKLKALSERNIRKLVLSRRIFKRGQ